MFRRSLAMFFGLAILLLAVDLAYGNARTLSSSRGIKGYIDPDTNQVKAALPAETSLQPDSGSESRFSDPGRQDDPHVYAKTAVTAPWFPEPHQVDSQVQVMIGQVLSNTVIQYDGDLSGEWPVLVGGQPYTITTRYTYSSEPIQKATQYVGERMASLGLAVDYHQWDGETYPNVIGELTGGICPDQIFIISAHLDDRPTVGLAPGADDNASGSTAVLIAADIFSQESWESTLRFAFWTGEEQGLKGSEAYAQEVDYEGQHIVGVLNLDMIGWNTPESSREMEVHAKSTVPGSLELAQLFAGVITTYGLELIPEIIDPGVGRSDHAAFWTHGYAAILAIEDFSDDFNPNYHKKEDLLDRLDINYFTEMVKAAVGTFAHMSRCQRVTYFPLVVNGNVPQ